MKVILYSQENGDVGYILPVSQDDLMDTAYKTVPKDRPFKFVASADVPPIKYQSAFECDFSEPDGLGKGPEQYGVEKEMQNEAELYRKATPEELIAHGVVLDSNGGNE
jgi:hypothetical protein